MFNHNHGMFGISPIIYMSKFASPIIAVFRLLNVLSAVSHEVPCPFDWQLSRLGLPYIFHIQGEKDLIYRVFINHYNVRQIRIELSAS